MAYFNFDDIKKVPGDFKLGDLNELLKFFKSKGTIIFVNFYKPRRPKIEVEEEEIDSHENDNEIMGEGKYQEKQEEEEEPKEEKRKKEPQRPTKKCEILMNYIIIQISSFSMLNNVLKCLINIIQISPKIVFIT